MLFFFVRPRRPACIERDLRDMLTFPQGLLSGKLSDSYGPRWPLLLGSFMHVFGLMMVSISTEYYQIFLAQCVCSGIGTSFLFYPSECISLHATTTLSLIMRQRSSQRPTPLI